MALNANLMSELQLWTSNEKLTMALNAKTGSRWWLWTPNEAKHGSEHRNRGRKSELQTRKWWWWLWTPKLKSDGGSERRTTRKWWLWTPTKMRWWLWTPIWECDSERQTRKWWWWLWTLKLKSDGGSERRTTRKWWEGNMPQCGMPLQISICWKGLKETLWAPKDALLASQNDQVDGEHSLRTCSKKSRGMSECRNKLNSSNS